MRQRRITYFTGGLIIQLSIFSIITYWFYIVATRGRDAAITHFSNNLPEFLQDTTVVIIITGALIIISMLCLGAARNLSLSRSFRNLTMGLILLNAVILLWIILSLM